PQNRLENRCELGPRLGQCIEVGGDCGRNLRLRYLRKSTYHSLSRIRHAVIDELPKRIITSLLSGLLTNVLLKQVEQLLTPGFTEVGWGFHRRLSLRDTAAK